MVCKKKFNYGLPGASDPRGVSFYLMPSAAGKAHRRDKAVHSFNFHHAYTARTGGISSSR